MSGADDSELVQHNTLIYNTILILLVLAELKVLRVNWKQFSEEGTLTYSSAAYYASVVHSFDPVCMFLSELYGIYTSLS